MSTKTKPELVPWPDASQRGTSRLTQRQRGQLLRVRAGLSALSSLAAAKLLCRRPLPPSHSRHTLQPHTLMSRIPVPNGGLHHLSNSPTNSPMSSQNNTPAAADTRRKQSRRDEVSLTSQPSSPYPPTLPPISSRPETSSVCLACLVWESTTLCVHMTSSSLL